MSTKLRIFQGDDESGSLLPVSTAPPASAAYSLRGAVGLYRYTTLLLWSCGILLFFILPVFAASLETPGFNTKKGPMAVKRLPSGPASFKDQTLLKPLGASFEELLANIDSIEQNPKTATDDDVPSNMETLRLLLPHTTLSPGSREYVTRTKPLAQILARRIQGSGLRLTLTVSSADRLSSAIQFVKELPEAAAISSDRVALSVSDDVPPDFLTIEIRCPLPIPESEE